MSLIANEINNHDNITDLKSVLIYTLNSVNFDENFSIKKERYISDAPDLIIISPQVIIEKPIIVNLSCEHIPGYPEGRPNANNGEGYGADGDDGKPGLPGFNGGNMMMVSFLISNEFTFVSKGGTGGPGQNGKKFIILI